MLVVFMRRGGGDLGVVVVVLIGRVVISDLVGRQHRAPLGVSDKHQLEECEHKQSPTIYNLLWAQFL